MFCLEWIWPVDVQEMVSNCFVSIFFCYCVHLFSFWLYWLVTQVSVCMKFGATEATPDIYTYSPHSIREAIKIIGCPQILRHKDGCKQSTVWLYIFSYSQFFWITYSCHTLTPTTTATATTVIYIYIYIYRLSSYFCFLHSEDGDWYTRWNIGRFSTDNVAKHSEPKIHWCWWFVTILVWGWRLFSSVGSD